MPIDETAYLQLKKELGEKDIALIAVSKKKTAEEIMQLYHLGHRDFGENYVQELLEKQSKLPDDIRWHFIGHLQRNKVRQIVPFVHLIQTIDSLRLLKEVNKQAKNTGRKIDCLLQVYIADEETKFGFDLEEIKEILDSDALSEYDCVHIKGLMGMASFTTDDEKIRREFVQLNSLFVEAKRHNPQLQLLSMGMSSDYKIAIDVGSNMVRIGSLIFGERT